MTRDERLSRLEAHTRKLEERLDKTMLLLRRSLEQLTEHNLRVRFILEHFKFQHITSPLIVGGEPQAEVVSLFDIYLEGGRDETLALLEQELIAAAEALNRGEAADLVNFEAPDAHQERADSQAAAESRSAGATAEGDAPAGGDAPTASASAVNGPCRVATKAVSG